MPIKPLDAAYRTTAQGSKEYGNPNFNPGAGAKNIQIRDSSGQVHSGVYSPEYNQTFTQPGQYVRGYEPKEINLTQAPAQTTTVAVFARDQGFNYMGQNYSGEAASVKYEQLKKEGVGVTTLGELKYKEKKIYNIRAAAVGLSNLPFLRRYRESQGLPSYTIKGNIKDVSARESNLKVISEAIGDKIKAPVAQGAYTKGGVKIPDKWLPKTNLPSTPLVEIPGGANKKPTDSSYIKPSTTPPGLYSYKAGLGWGEVTETQSFIPKTEDFSLKSVESIATSGQPEYAKLAGFDYGLKMGVGRVEEKASFSLGVDNSDIDKALSKFTSPTLEKYDILLTPAVKQGLGEYRAAEYEKRTATIAAEGDKAKIAEAEKQYAKSIKDITTPPSVKVNFEKELSGRYSKNPFMEVAQRAANLDIPVVDFKTNLATNALIGVSTIEAAPFSAALGSYTGGAAFQASKAITPEGIPALQVGGFGLGTAAAGMIKSAAFPYNKATEFSEANRASFSFKSGLKEVATTISKEYATPSVKTSIKKYPTGYVSPMRGTGKVFGGSLQDIIPLKVKVSNLLGETKTIDTFRNKGYLTTTEIGLGKKAGTPFKVVEKIGDTLSTRSYYGEGKKFGTAQPIAQQNIVAQTTIKGKLYTGAYKFFMGERKTPGFSMRESYIEKPSISVKDLAKPQGETIGTTFKSYKLMGKGTIQEYGQKYVRPMDLETYIGKTTKTETNLARGLERVKSKMGGYTLEKYGKYREQLYKETPKEYGKGKKSTTTTGGVLELRSLQELKTEQIAAAETVTRQAAALQSVNKLSFKPMLYAMPKTTQIQKSFNLQKTIQTPSYYKGTALLQLSKPTLIQSQPSESKSLYVSKTLQIPKTIQTSSMSQLTKLLQTPKQTQISKQIQTPKTTQITKTIQLPPTTQIKKPYTYNPIIPITGIPPTGGIFGGGGSSYGGPSFKKLFGKRFWRVKNPIKEVREVKRISMKRIFKFKGGY